MCRKSAKKVLRNELMVNYYHDLIRDGYSKMRAYEVVGARYHLSVNRVILIIKKSNQK